MKAPPRAGLRGATANQLKSKTMEYYQADRLRHDEYNDCAVKAIACVTGVSYDMAHEALKQLGRRNRRGAYLKEMLPRLSTEFDFSFRLLSFMQKTTVSRVADCLPTKGRFLVFVRGHVLPLVDGKVWDWTEGRRHVVRSIVEVKCERAFQTPLLAELPKATLVKDWRELVAPRVHIEERVTSVTPKGRVIKHYFVGDRKFRSNKLAALYIEGIK